LKAPPQHSRQAARFASRIWARDSTAHGPAITTIPGPPITTSPTLMRDDSGCWARDTSG
jgi:hypothetical protein